MPERPQAPTGAWLTAQLRRAEQHAANVEPLLAAALEEVLTAAGDMAARGFTARATSLTAAAPLPASTMICLKPTLEQAAALALPDGEPPDILHVTLAYLGETVGPLGWLVDVLRPFAMEYAALNGVVGGIGSFTDMGDGYPVLALPDVPGLNELRTELVEELAEAGVAYATNHGFTPHITLAYRPAPVFVAEALGVPLTFADLVIVRGDTEVIPLPLSGVPALTAAVRQIPPSWHEEASGLELRPIRDTALAAALEPAPGAPGWYDDLAGGLAQRFAPGDHAWIPPAGDEVIDVDALIARITARTKPVRDAAVRAAMGSVAPALAGLPPEAASLGDAVARVDLDATDPSDLIRNVPNERGLVTAGRSALGQMEAGGWLRNVSKVEIMGSFVAKGVQPADLDLLMTVDKLSPQQLELMRAVTGDIDAPHLRHPFGDDVHALFIDASGETPYDEKFAERLRRGTAQRYDRPPEVIHETAVPRTVFDPVNGIHPSFDVTNPFVGKVLAQSGSQIVDIAHTTQLNAMRIIRASYTAGLSIPHTAAAIREGMAEAAPARARLIARTELAGAVNGGSLAAVRIVEHATGTPYHKVWMTAPGAKHPRHYLYDGLNGQARKLPAKFDVGGHEFDHPGDPEGYVGDVVNCRCAMRYGEGPPPPL